MCETTNSEDEKTQSNESDGFKFAVTLLAALGTIIYTAFTYLQNTAVDIYWYAFICGLISVSVILVFGLLFYVFIRGYLMGVHNAKQEVLERLASRVYYITLSTFMFLLAFILLAFTWAYLKKFQSTPSIWVVVTVLIIIIFAVYLKKDQLKKLKILGPVFTRAQYSFPGDS